MASMGVDAMTPGASDFALGRGFLIEMQEAYNLPYVAANLNRSHGSQLFPGSIIKDLGDHKVALIGIVPETLSQFGVTVSDPTEALRAEVAVNQQRGADLFILLSSLGQEDTKRLAAAVPEVDFAFVSGSGRTTTAPIIQGDSILLEAGRRGKNIGVVSLDIQDVKAAWVDVGEAERSKVELERAKDRLKSLERRQKGAKTEKEKTSLARNITFYQSRVEALTNKTATPETGKNPFGNRFVPLSQSVEDAPAVAKMIEIAKKDIEAASLAGAPKEDDTAFAGLAGPDRIKAMDNSDIKMHGNFVGAETCKGCHPGPYDQWSRTPHAKAWSALVEDHRSQDLQCFSCHVTGSFADDGPKDPATVGYLKNVQCESCHTGGREHALNPTGVKLPAQVPEATCITCHTQEMTGGRFDYKSYLPQVIHGSAP